MSQGDKTELFRITRRWDCALPYYKEISLSSSVLQGDRPELFRITRHWANGLKPGSTSYYCVYGGEEVMIYK